MSAAPHKQCDYCGEPAELLYGAERNYPYQRDYGPVWACVPCKAWVGCHPGTTNPLGRLADAELREWKMLAHAAFDPLWRAKNRREGCSKGYARRSGYRWLATQMGKSTEEMHIGYLDVDDCKRVIEICESRRRPNS